MSSDQRFNRPTDDGFRDVYSISRLNRETRSLLEGSFPLLWVEGEISNFARPASGHWYFSLKDEAAQVRCAMFRNRNSITGFTPKNGTQVLIRARIGLYEARGEFQIIAEHMEESGDGALRRAFEQLKQRLDQQGLFSSSHKQPLPADIRTIGVITSATGAAVRDILTTLKRRNPSAKVIIYPVAVQGDASAPQIAAMLKTVEHRNESDVILLVRGGGSLEDLWAFNEDVVAQAIYNCPIPIVSGIGHEVDITIADLVADFRAATPTAAAELVSPNQFELRTKLKLLRTRLKRSNQRNLQQLHQQLTMTAKRLRHPDRRMQAYAQRIDELQARSAHAIRSLLQKTKLQQRILVEKLTALHPQQQITTRRLRCHALATQLRHIAEQQLQTKQQQFLHLTNILNTVSPLATLERGYAIVTHNDTDIIHNSNALNIGDNIKAQLRSGKIICKVTDIEND